MEATCTTASGKGHEQVALSRRQWAAVLWKYVRNLNEVVI